MSSKKKITPVVENSDDEVDQVIDEVPEVKEVKKRTKKDRTPAQQESFKKALETLKLKRESKKKEDEERLSKATAEEKDRIAKEKYEKAKNHHRKLPPAPSYVTTGDLEKFKSDILNAIPKWEAPKVIEKEVEKPKPQPVVKIAEPNPIEKPVIQPKIQKQLTGHELLDKLFFS